MRKRRPRNELDCDRLAGGTRGKIAEKREKIDAELVPLSRPTLSEQMIAAVCEYQREHFHRNDIAICEEAQISVPCLSTFRNGTRNASAVTLNKLADVVGVKLVWKKGRKPIEIPDWLKDCADKT